MTADTINQILYASSLGFSMGLVIWYQKKANSQFEKNFKEHLEAEEKKTNAYIGAIEKIKDQINVLDRNQIAQGKDIEYLKEKTA